MISCQYPTCCKVLKTTYSNGSLINPGIFRKETPLIVPFPINERFNSDKLLNVPEEAGSVIEPKEKLIVNSPKKPIPLPKVPQKVEISTKKAPKRKASKDREGEIDLSPSKTPKPTNLSKYRLKV